MPSSLIYAYPPFQVGYNDPGYLATRHGIDKCGEAVQNMGKALAGFAAAAVK